MQSRKNFTIVLALKHGQMYTGSLVFSTCECDSRYVPPKMSKISNLSLSYMFFQALSSDCASSSSSLIVSCTRLFTVGDRAFPIAAARVWNSLPDHVTSAPSVAVFRSRLKTHLFNICYPSPLWLYSARAVTLSCFRHYNHSSLLTNSGCILGDRSWCSKHGNGWRDEEGWKGVPDWWGSGRVWWSLQGAYILHSLSFLFSSHIHWFSLQSQACF